jgi:hypothetical protein
MILLGELQSQMSGSTAAETSLHRRKRANVVWTNLFFSDSI